MKYKDAPPKAVLRFQGEAAQTLRRDIRELPPIPDDPLLALLVARLRVRVDQLTNLLAIRSNGRKTLQAEQVDTDRQRNTLSLETQANAAQTRANLDRTTELDHRRIAMQRRASGIAEALRTLREEINEAQD